LALRLRQRNWVSWGDTGEQRKHLGLADGIKAVTADVQGRDAPALERAEELF
jgi:hypothetical protein